MDIKALIESSENRVIEALKGEIEDLKSTITSLSAKLSTLESRQKELEAKHEQELASFKREQLLVCTELSNELDERMRRSTNFVISGIPEESLDSESQSAFADKDMCFEAVRTVGGDVDSIVKLSRIGRSKQSRPRLLKVTCNSMAVKEFIISNAKELRKVTKFKGVYINPDRTPMQQRLWKDLLNELRTQKEEGKDAVIFRNRVILRREAKNS